MKIHKIYIHIYGPYVHNFFLQMEQILTFQNFCQQYQFDIKGSFPTQSSKNPQQRKKIHGRYSDNSCRQCQLHDDILVATATLSFVLGTTHSRNKMTSQNNKEHVTTLMNVDLPHHLLTNRTETGIDSTGQHFLEQFNANKIQK